LAHSCHRRLEKERFRLRELNTRLKALSPSVVLSRGYGIIRTVPAGSIVRDPRRLTKDQELEVLVEKGSFGAKVIGK